MNILFIHSQKDALYGDKPLSTHTLIQLGISYISSCLKEKGHQTRLLVLTNRDSFSKVDSEIRAFSPSLACFTSVFSEYSFIAEAAAYLKTASPNCYLLLGGPHASLNPEKCLSNAFDALCIGEGEAATLELVRQMEKGESPSNICNLWIKKRDAWEKNPCRPFLQNLDCLPFPDREMWQEWVENRESSWPVLLGRGCPFKCTYCCNHALSRLAEGSYVRVRSVDNVMSELEEMVGRYHVSKVYFEIETFGIDIDWAVKLCRRLAEFNKGRSRPLTFGTNLRISPNMQLERLFKAMSNANFDYVNIGLESGNERVRKTILKRYYSNGDLMQAIAIARRYGIKASLYIMIGIPGETAEDFDDTIKITRKCRPDYYELFIFSPYPGTELYSIAEEGGLIDGNLRYEKERSRPVLDLPGFSRKEILTRYVWFDYHVSRDYKPLPGIFAAVLRNKIYSSPLLYRAMQKLLSKHSSYQLALKIKRNLILNK